MGPFSSSLFGFDFFILFYFISVSFHVLYVRLTSSLFSYESFVAAPNAVLLCAFRFIVCVFVTFVAAETLAYCVCFCDICCCRNPCSLCVFLWHLLLPQPLLIVTLSACTDVAARGLDIRQAPIDITNFVLHFVRVKSCVSQELILLQWRGLGRSVWRSAGPQFLCA